MPGYDRDGYEDLDEYEEEGEEQEEEEVEEDELEEEEAHQPTQEELEYLELRQRLKEVIRKQMKKDTGSARTSAREAKNKLPYDNYGSFFGPSQPVIAQRVIQESKSLLENPRLAAKVSESNKSNMKGFASTPVGSKPRANDRPPKVTSGLKSKTKVQMLKNTRDYSFLLSDDAELPAPTKDPPPRNFCLSNSEAQSAQVPSKSKQLSTNSGRIFPNGRDRRKPVPTGGSQMQPKVGPHKLASASKPNMTSVDSRKQLGSNYGNGPGRPPGSKGLPSKIPVAAMEKKVTAPGAKSPMPGVHKPLPSKLQSSIRKQPLVHKKEFQESSQGKMSKQLVSSSKPQIKQPPAKISARATLQENRSKKRPVRQYSDDDEDDDGGRAISMIRNMFRYNPNKYRDDDDDSDMEANFNDILREERRSAKIAREEDEEELRKIEEEERRERLRKAAKKRKLSQ